jgi:hypothetical protein
MGVLPVCPFVDHPNATVGSEPDRSVTGSRACGGGDYLPGDVILLPRQREARADAGLGLDGAVGLLFTTEGHWQLSVYARVVPRTVWSGVRLSETTTVSIALLRREISALPAQTSGLSATGGQ